MAASTGRIRTAAGGLPWLVPARWNSCFLTTAGGAASRRMVLLPPSGEGNPVLLEVADPDGFVTQLRAAWH